MNFLMRRTHYVTVVQAFIFTVIVLHIVYFPSAAQESSDVRLCAGCHDEVVSSIKDNPHVSLDRKKAHGGESVEFSCAACHKGYKAHVEDYTNTAGMTTFSEKETPISKTAACVQCHKKKTSRFFSSVHGFTGTDCMRCHSIHSENEVAGYLLKESTVESCRECHPSIYARFNLNEHHPLKEGFMVCTSCHEVHGPSRRRNLSGYDPQICYKCHAFKRGPYLYEHGGVLIEGCTGCHDPHGSVNRHLLLFQSVADLCYSCHAEVPVWHQRFTRQSNCTDCHAAIHGSNLSSYFGK